ncbi:protein-cysteine N-palmitoyltransferase Rasp [Anopheles ziemanni]|uniref:protein-cysteine N-palmitoyltransferase Rasp n=1 Tax=Anopheles coustani TaxID=139045 RepID=UPI00265AAB98|nr:protein-cysteine N-palmitoyltransferase Rasp [Anopheles coustani]XP_058171439.1 protein-cysteine N-palmitoyltransferase Rasp [Anopheles ziemanni]
MAKKPSLELIACCILYVTCLLYSFYKNYELSNENLPNYHTLDDGWFIFRQRRRDDFDWEWEHYIQFVRRHGIFFVLHICLMELCRRYGRQLSTVLAIYGVIFIFFMYNVLVLAVLLFQCVSFYYGNSGKNYRRTVWLKAVFWIAFINYFKVWFFYDKLNVYLNIDNDQLLQLSLIVSWNVIKCISFCLDKQRDPRPTEHYGLLDLLGYLLYFPLLLMGPAIVYSRFKTIHISTECNQRSNTLNRFTILASRLAMALFWTMVMLVGQHFLYVNLIQQDHVLLQNVNLWALYGLGFLMGQFFYIKYIVFYGVGIAFGSFDGIDMPAKPICIARVNQYSDMWKYFDRSLYEFLFKYIYTQLCTKTSPMPQKILASLATFAFIYVWHGVFLFILIWSFINWLCILLERLVNHYTPAGSRWRAIIGTHVFIPSVVSNFFFFASEQVGFIYLRRTYTEGISNYLGLYAASYCFYQTGQLVKILQTKR